MPSLTDVQSSAHTLPDQHKAYADWNHLVRVVAAIDPPRARSWICTKKPQGFVEILLEQTDYVPDDFHLWILEWPARAIMFCAWPGLPEFPLGGVHNYLIRILPLVETVHINLVYDSDEVNDTENPESYVDLPALRVMIASRLGWFWTEGRRRSTFMFDPVLQMCMSKVRGIQTGSHGKVNS
ncbi:hypothetical protein C8R44DRAFT_889793 [Mycena epipterygia]|nr:hypothetical protein C8R44DRAFT_889793 [Mycena epipterygia]